MDESLHTSIQKPQSADRDELVEQGERALAALSRQLELLKTESRRAELESALAEAQRGNRAPLRSWLLNNEPCIAENLPTPIPSPDSLGLKNVTRTDARDEYSSWDAIREQSLNRLAKMAVDEPSDKTSDARITQEAENQSQSDKRPLEKRNLLRADSPAAPKRKPAATTKSKVAQQPSRATQVIDGLNWTPEDLRATEGGAQQSNKAKWQLGGLAISALLHTFLILGLMLATVAAPQLGGILQFEASDSTDVDSHSVEVVNTVEATTPTDQAEAIASDYQPSLDAALPNLGDMALQASPLEVLAVSANSSQMSQALKATGSSKATKTPMNLGAQFFGASATGGFFVFLVDGSNSMKGGAWEAARDELIRSLSSLADKQRYYVIFYKRDDLSRVPDPATGNPATSGLYATKDNLQTTVNWLSTLQIGVGGNQFEVLAAALELEPDAIFYLTDGEMGETVQNRIFKFLATENRVTDIVEGELVRVPIHAIAYHSEKGVPLMQKIANENRGQFSYVPKPVADKSGTRRR